MSEQQQQSDNEKRDELVKTFSQAAVRAHDKGNDAAAHGLTVAALKLMTEKKK